MAERKSLMLRLDPAMYDALACWAGDELRSTNAQIEYLLREALARTGRLPAARGRVPRRSRPPEADIAPPVCDQNLAPQPVAD
jgi:hypothetical protein